MLIVSILPHADFGRNDDREDAPNFISAGKFICYGFTLIPPKTFKKSKKISFEIFPEKSGKIERLAFSLHISAYLLRPEILGRNFDKKPITQ